MLSGPNSTTRTVNESDQSEGDRLCVLNEKFTAELKCETSNNDSQKADAENPSGAEDDYPTGVRLGAIVLALILSIFLVSLDLTIVSTAIPRITTEFNS